MIIRNFNFRHQLFSILNTVTLLLIVQGIESANLVVLSYSQNHQQFSNIPISSVKKGSFMKENLIQIDHKNFNDEEVKDNLCFRKFVDRNSKEDKYFPINILKKGGKLSNIYLSEGPRPDPKSKSLSYMYSAGATTGSIYSCSNFYNSLTETTESEISTEFTVAPLNENLSNVTNAKLCNDTLKPNITSKDQNITKTIKDGNDNASLSICSDILQLNSTSRNQNVTGTSIKDGNNASIGNDTLQPNTSKDENVTISSKSDNNNTFVKVYDNKLEPNITSKDQNITLNRKTDGNNNANISVNLKPNVTNKDRNITITPTSSGDKEVQVMVGENNLKQNIRLTDQNITVTPVNDSNNSANVSDNSKTNMTSHNHNISITPFNEGVLKFSEKGVISNGGNNNNSKPSINASYEFQIIIPHSAMTLSSQSTINPLSVVTSCTQNLMISEKSETQCLFKSTECNAATAYAIS